MLTIADGAEIYLVPGATDMRKGVDTLVTLASSLLDDSICNGAYFIFCSKRRNTIKIVYWERNGFCLWYKRLEKEKFWWPTNDSEAYKIDSFKIRWILDGLNPNEMSGHKIFKYKTVH